MVRSFGLLGLGAGCFLGEGWERRLVTVLSGVSIPGLHHHLRPAARHGGHHRCLHLRVSLWASLHSWRRLWGPGLWVPCWEHGWGGPSTHGQEEGLGCRCREKMGVGPRQGVDSLGMTLLVSDLLHRKPVGDFVRANMAMYYAS